MRRRRFPPGDPREWLSRARSSLAKSKVGIPDVYLEDLCFDAQQAAEKAIKAVLLSRGLRVPRIHDIGRLLDTLQEVGERIPLAVRRAVPLTRFSVEARYPAFSPPIRKRDHQQAVRRAEAVVAWADACLA